ncbi:MAG: hypothetical protein KJ574_04715 [Nanoarchaeota archaeon]|nr:hypothetical protein [Nanoarchaeota archaeon]
MVVFVGFMLFTYINNKASDIGFEKRYIATDLGLLMTAIYSAPGNLIHHYHPPVNMAGKDVKLKISIGGYGAEDTRIFVKEEGGNLNPPLYYYARDRTVPRYFLQDYPYPITMSTLSLGLSISAAVMSDTPLELGDLSTTELTFYRFGYDLDDNIERTNYIKITCPPIPRDDEDEETGTTNWQKAKKIYFDVTQTNPADIYSTNENKVGEQIKTNLVNKQAFIMTENAAEADVEIGLRARRKTELGSIRVYIFDSSPTLKEARTLACSLINELLTPETYVPFVQVVPVRWSTNDTWLKLLTDNPERNNTRVVLEFGIVDESMMDSENVARAVFNALARFYGTKVRLPTSGATITPYLLTTTMQALSQQPAAQEAAAAQAAEQQLPCTADQEKMVDFPFKDELWLKEGEQNGGRVWVPSQANCPGTYPLIIFLHGIQANPPRVIHGNMNRNGPGEGGYDLTQDAKELITTGQARPFLMAAPSQDNEASANSVWRGFDTTDFVSAVKNVLPEGVEIGQVLVLGHSGAGCDRNGGIHTAAKSSYPQYLFAQIDTCMNGEYGRALKSDIDSDQIFVSLYLPVHWNARTSSDPRYDEGWDEQNAVMGMTTNAPCPDFTYESATFTECKSNGQNWYSYQVTGLRASGDDGAHGKMKKLALRFIATQFLPATTAGQAFNALQQMPETTEEHLAVEELSESEAQPADQETEPSEQQPAEQGGVSQ